MSGKPLPDRVDFRQARVVLAHFPVGPPLDRWGLGVMLVPEPAPDTGLPPGPCFLVFSLQVDADHPEGPPGWSLMTVSAADLFDAQGTARPVELLAAARKALLDHLEHALDHSLKWQSVSGVETPFHPHRSAS